MQTPDHRVWPSTGLRGLWPADTPWWHTALYLLFVLGDAAAAFGQDGRQTWQDVLMGVLLPVAVLGILRRTTWPLVLPLVAVPAVALAGSSMLPIAVLSLVLRRRDRLTGVLLVAGAVALASPFADAYTGLTSAGEDPVRVSDAAGLLELGANVAAQVAVPALLGGYLAVRRRLTLEETERRRLADDARQAREREGVLAERRRIAAEMHDAVGHQLALISLQAGALEVNPAAGPEVVERHAAAVRTAATTAARDLRAILDVLGSDDAPAAHEPQPGLSEVPTLLERTRGAGAQVRAELDLGPVDRVAPSTGRAAYRIVQESVTNALRHAHGRPITVSLTASPAGGVVIAVTNPIHRTERADGDPEARTGLGLGGLSERARSVGGTLSARPERGPVGQELWAVRAHLPWREEER